MPSPVRRTRPLVLSATLLAVLLTFALGFQSTSSAAGGVLAPGNFTGMGFDACAAPSAATMDKWMKAKENPYRAVGVYISGGLRACSQPNLTASWISHVTGTGWHVLPLTVGPQASCTGFSKRISDNPANMYAAARAQGRTEATTAVSTAGALGIAPRSTLFYDMESWHTGYDRCDASTLWFLAAWTTELHRLGYASGIYSSASTGIRLLDKIASAPPANYVNPDHIWYAQWNDKADTATSYINAGHWTNHQRVHQFYGGHNATNGGVKLNIDSNWLDLTTPVLGGGPKPTPTPTPTPTPSPTAAPTPTVPATPTAKPAPTPTNPVNPATVTCTRDRVSRTSYPNTDAHSAADQVIAAQCLLRRAKLYTGKVDGVWTPQLTTGLRSFQRSVGLPQRSWLDNRTWTALLSAGFAPSLRMGSSQPVPALLALARALNAAAGAQLHGTAYFGELTRTALIRYQRALFGKGSGVADARTWAALHHGEVIPGTAVRPRVEAGQATTATTPAPSASATPDASPSVTPSPTASATPTTGPGTDPATVPVAPGATDPALSVKPAHKVSQRAIGVQAPTHKGAPALPKARQLTVPQMVPHAAPVTPVRAPLFSTALQSRMWTMMNLLDTHAQDVVAAFAPWLAATEAVDGS